MCNSLWLWSLTRRLQVHNVVQATHKTTHRIQPTLFRLSFVQQGQSRASQVHDC